MRIAIKKHNLRRESLTNCVLVAAMIIEPFLRLTIGAVSDGIIGPIKIMLFLLAVAINLNKINSKALMLILAIIAFVAIECVIGRNATKVVERFISGEFILSLLLFVALSLKIPVEELKHRLCLMSLFICLGNSLCAITGRYAYYSENAWYMLYGYGTVLYWSFLLFLSKKTTLMNIYIVAVAIMLVVFGNRGVILIILCSYLVYCFTSMPSKRIAFWGILILLLLGIVFYDSILISLGNFLQIKQIDSRNIQMLALSNIGKDSTRMQMIKESLIQIERTFPFGGGLCFDAVLFGNYAHNFILELLLSWGLLGAIVSVKFVSICIKGILDKSIVSSLIVPVSISAFITLFFSKSIFIANETYILLAIVMYKKWLSRDEGKQCIACK